MTRRVVRFFVTGRVQGVGFRHFLVREANALGLDGWTRNRSDGSVETFAAGPEAAVAAFLQAARRGPAASRVDLLREVEAEAEAEGVAGEGGFHEAATL